jgi:hypothetical protein
VVYFGEHEWLLRHGSSRFSAWLDSRTKTTADIHWELSLVYLAAGAPWRRVESYDRPTLSLYLPCFRPELRTWRDLERMNFWEPDAHERDADGDLLDWPGGWLQVEYNNRPLMTKPEFSRNLKVIWRVAAADGPRYTVELVGRADGFDQLRGALGLVLPDGGLDRDEDYSDRAGYWKGKAELYVIEEVPFGLVTVQVSRNARAPIAVALGQAQSLLGLGEPEHIQLSDYVGHPHASPLTVNDLYVSLHYHGYYED